MSEKQLTIYKLRPGLMIYKKRELESIIIEIIQKDSKNMVVGCIYDDIHVCNIVSSMTNIENLSQKN